jgi:hypothetical protein
MTNPVVVDAGTRRGRERRREIWTGVKASVCSAEDLARAAAAGYEPGPEGDGFVGCDLRTMSQDSLLAIGHEAMSPIAEVPRLLRRPCP